MSFGKRQGTDAVCYTKPLDSLKGWNDHFFWIDAFACPDLFSWHTGKSVSRDVIPKSSEFRPEHYATLIAYPALFHKYLEPFLCLVGMSHLLSFIGTANPTKVRIGERQRDEFEPKLLETTVGRVVSLQPVAPDQSSTPKKQKTKVVDAGEPSHPAKKSRDDYGAPGGPTVDGKSLSSIQRLFDGAVQNAEVTGRIMPTLPFVSSSVFTTPEREDGDHTELLARANLRIIGAPQRFVISSDSSDHSGVNIAKAEVDSVVRTSMLKITSATTTTPTADHAAIGKEKLVGSSVFGADSLFTGERHPKSGGFSDCSGSDFLIGGIRTVIDPDSNLQKVYVPQWNVTNESCLDDGGVCREMVDELAPPNFFASIRGMDYDQLFTKFNVGVARQVSLSTKVRMRAEYHIKEKRRLKVVVEEKNQVLKARDKEIENLKARLLLKEAKAAKAIRLRAETFKLEAAKKSLRDEVSSSELKEKLSNYENLTERLEEFQDALLKVVNDKFDKLYDDFVEVTLHLEERFYLHLLTTIVGRKWLLTHGMELAISKCLNSPEYLSALGTTVSKAIEKGMQDGLVARIIHSREGRVLTDVAAHNPAAKADYVSALQQLQSVNFSLLAELKANKDASIEVVMNILCLEEHLAASLGLNELQPHVDPLMVPIYHSLDKTIVGASALSLALDVSDARVRRIRENIMSHMSLFQDVFVSLAEPLFAAALTDMEGTSSAAPATVDLTTALSVTLASAGTVTSFFVDDYGVIGTDDQSAVNESVVDKDANPFPNVDNVELNIP
nr:putative transposase (putative), gypsy type [Tanacetum cinerariifolium]